jgi:hypothetical protein
MSVLADVISRLVVSISATKNPKRVWTYVPTEEMETLLPTAAKASQRFPAITLEMGLGDPTVVL